MKQADLALCLKPGTDGALACAIMHCLFRDGYADRDFLKEFSDEPAALESHLQDKTPQWASAITGLPVAEIEAFAALLGERRRSYFRLGYGFTRSRNGAANMHAALCIATVMGAWQFEGGGAMHSNADIYGMKGSEIKGAKFLDPEIRSLDQSRIGSVLMGEKGALNGVPAVTAMLGVAGVERSSFEELLLDGFDPVAHLDLVIDASPGGSVMEGFRIVTAMQNSDAPIHVVVKSYAASMAAVITTLAEESYVYPHALILHHQMSSGMSGNLTQQRESLEEGYEWAARLADPVAEKMGVTPERFTELMYENNSDGDWGEFGDIAVGLKWANHVVTEINETAIITAPGGAASSRTIRIGQADDTPFAGFTQDQLFECPIQYETCTDGNGNSYVALPRLVPGDLYYIANPDNYYRIAR